jgi:Ser/Thr protein kinase RdoA (MazF antagonist)
MSALSRLIDAQPPGERAATFNALADAALRTFGVTAHDVVFLGHNSGAAFRVESADAGRLLLKIHAPQGEGEPLSDRAILGGLQWLAVMAELTDTPVQTPLPDPQGALLPSLNFRGLSLPCSLQRWLDGHHVDELSTDQAHGVGALMGRWHTFSEQQGTTFESAVPYDVQYLTRALDDLRAVSTTGVMSGDCRDAIERATELACILVDSMGTAADVFGVIHGDVNPDNIIVSDDGAVRFIDLAQLAIAPYLWDLGTALYQFSYQAASVRRAMVTGYRSVRPGLTFPPLALETFVCAAALTNLAFQVSIPAQRVSPLFHANLQKFARGYCRDLVNGVPFALD